MGCKSSRAQRKPKLHEEAVEKLRAHFLLGPVARALFFYPSARMGRVQLPDKAYCQLEGNGTVTFNEKLKLTTPQWLGIFALVVLVYAVGGPRRLPVPSLISDLAAQIAALHWWHQLKVGELPEHIELPPEILQWGRQPIELIATRLRSEPPDEVLDGGWTLTRSTEALMRTAAMHPEFRIQRTSTPARRARRRLDLPAMGSFKLRVLSCQERTWTPSKRCGPSSRSRKPAASPKRRAG